jgi:ankyrin repeat protein
MSDQAPMTKPRRRIAVFIASFASYVVLVGAVLFTVCLSLRNDNALLEAVRQDNSTEVARLLAANCDPNARDWDGNSVLCYARSGPIARMLIQAGAASRAANGEGNTPLHFASYYGRIDVVAVLLANGANPNATNNLQETPLHWAAVDGMSDPDAAAKFSDLSFSGKARAVDMLVTAGGRVNAKDWAGSTPLHLAYSIGDKGLVKHLIAQGANESVRDVDGVTPIERGRGTKLY